SSQCCAWRINSSGVVFDPGGGSYVVTVLTDGWPTEASGIDGNETVSRAIADKLARPLGAPHYFLRNSLSAGFADTVFTYGDPGDTVVTGDWNGDGKDTIAIVRGAQWFLRDSNSTGVADHTLGFGDPGDQPIAGDWNGDHLDTVGVHRGDVFYLRNQNTSG